VDWGFDMNRDLFDLPMHGRLDIPAFSRMLDLDKLTNSYKLYWFGAFFDEVCMGCERVSFRRLVILMICKCWYSVLEYRLNLGRLDQLSSLVWFVHDNFGFNKNMSEFELAEALESLISSELEKRMSRFYKYVPFRLISPFFSMPAGLKDSDKNSLIEKLSVEKKYAPYSVCSSEKMITINPLWQDYFIKNESVIRGWFMSKLIFFLQKRNPNVPAIAFKISAPVSRDLKSARDFWGKIISIHNVSDIYSDLHISVHNLSIDHFIPWSFVLHDRLWNLVPTCREINSSKGNRLAPVKPFFEKFCEIQYMGFLTAILNDFKCNEIEDYFDIGLVEDFSSVSRVEFFNSLRNTVSPLYQMARNQGFGVWDGGYGAGAGGSGVAAEGG